MRRTVCVCVLMLGVFHATAPCGRAEMFTLVERSMTDLLGNSYLALGSFRDTTMNAGNLHSDVYNQAFSGNGKYLYLYQVVNTGVTGNSSAERFSLGGFGGSIANKGIGYLGGVLPSDFSTDGEKPEDRCKVASLATGLEVAFQWDWEDPVAPYEHSRVLFILSDNAPGLVTGNVIDGYTATGSVVGAVPEPAALGLLIPGAAATACYVARRRRTRHSAERAHQKS